MRHVFVSIVFVATIFGAVSTASAQVPDTCPVTIQNDIGTGRRYGDWQLSTVLWEKGEFIFRPGGSGFVTPDGAVGIKYPWWRGVRGTLHIEGRRLDGPAGPLRSEFVDYGTTGFQASYVIFPTPGCWEVTGRAGDARLTFVTRIVKIGDGPSWRREPRYRSGNR
jgi:hypothetical protein